MRRPLCLLVAFLALVVRSSQARGDGDPEAMPVPHLRMRAPATLRASNGHDYLIPEGAHVLAPDAWSKYDAELRELQEARTRLTAENQSFRKSAAEWKPGWVTIVSVLAVGISGGVYLGAKL